MSESLLGVLIGALISLCGIWFSNYLQYKQAIEKEIRKKREDAYREVILTLNYFRFGVESKEVTDSGGINSLAQKNSTNLVMYGSPETIKLYNETVRQIKNLSVNHTLINFDALHNQIRRELGIQGKL